MMASLTPPLMSQPEPTVGKILKLLDFLPTSIFLFLCDSETRILKLEENKTFDLKPFQYFSG